MECRDPFVREKAGNEAALEVLLYAGLRSKGRDFKPGFLFNEFSNQESIYLMSFPDDLDT